MVPTTLCSIKIMDKALNKDLGISVNHAIDNHNLIKNCQLYTLDKLISKELHKILLWLMCKKLTSQRYDEKLLKTTNLNWKEIKILPRIIYIGGFVCLYLCIFQSKILNEIFFLNKLLFKFKRFSSPQCYFCNSANETPLHIFYTCNITNFLWNELQNELILSHFPQFS